MHVNVGDINVVEKSLMGKELVLYSKYYGVSDWKRGLGSPASSAIKTSYNIGMKMFARKS
jgi:hypothetical protein